MAGLIVQGLGGRSAAFTLVDDERWEHILEVHKAYDWGKTPRRLDQLVEIIGWMTCTDLDVSRPDGAPEERRGDVVKTWYTQTFVVEAANISDVKGIITIS